MYIYTYTAMYIYSICIYMFHACLAWHNRCYRHLKDQPLNGYTFFSRSRADGSVVSQILCVLRDSAKATYGLKRQAANMTMISQCSTRVLSLAPSDYFYLGIRPPLESGRWPHFWDFWRFIIDTQLKRAAEHREN